MLDLSVIKFTTCFFFDEHLNPNIIMDKSKKTQIIVWDEFTIMSPFSTAS